MRYFRTVFGMIALLPVLILINACDRYSDCLSGNGNIESEERLTAQFYGVINETSFDVEIVEDTVYQVKVTADENLLSEIKTSVKGENLYIDVDNDRCINSREYILVEIRMPVLDLVELTGSGDMEVDYFDCNRIQISNSGSGDIDVYRLNCNRTVNMQLSGSGNIRVEGKTLVSSYTLSGSGDILGDELYADDCRVISSGSGDISCWADESLYVEMTGSGDVDYYGTPVVESHISGSGDLRHRSK